MGTQTDPHWILVPASSLDHLETQIKTVKENLIRKQHDLIKVITQQQCLINNQTRALAKYEKILNTDKTQHLAFLHNQCSPTDSGLDVDVAADPGDDSDSYITMSDSSVMTDNETVTSDKLGKPVMMREFYHNNATAFGLKYVKDERKQSEETELFRSLSITSRDEPKTIGDPETNATQFFLRKSKKFFRKTRNNSPIFKSKSEGNIKELIEREPRNTFMQSIYQGFTSLNFRYSEKMPNTESENTFLSLGSEVTTLNHNQENVSRMRKQEIPSMKSLPCLSQSESLLSCFAIGGKQIKPNHRSVQRPRDIKNKNLRKYGIFV